MKPLLILKTGTTFADTLGQYGDFDLWIRTTIGTTMLRIETIDVDHGAELPQAESFAGAIITGPHAMVSDNFPWSLKLEKWLVTALTAEVPLFAICYGHQLLGRAAGGEVGYHPGGKEVGTVQIELDRNQLQDPIFADLSQSLKVHATYAQSELKLPPEAQLR